MAEAAETALVPVDVAKLKLPARRTTPRTPDRRHRRRPRDRRRHDLGRHGVQSALPGESLYPIKRVIESAHPACPSARRARAATELANASSRLDEVTALTAGRRLGNDERIAQHPRHLHRAGRPRRRPAAGRLRRQPVTRVLDRHDPRLRVRAAWTGSSARAAIPDAARDELLAAANKFAHDRCRGASSVPDLRRDADHLDPAAVRGRDDRPPATTPSTTASSTGDKPPRRRPQRRRHGPASRPPTPQQRPRSRHRPSAVPPGEPCSTAADAAPDRHPDPLKDLTDGLTGVLTGTTPTGGTTRSRANPTGRPLTEVIDGVDGMPARASSTRSGRAAAPDGPATAERRSASPQPASASGRRTAAASAASRASAGWSRAPGR